jgi:hypothetical protein
MKRLFLALIALLTFSVCKAQQQPNPKVWTPEYEKAAKDTLYAQFKATFPNDDQRKQFTDCFVAKLKTMLPNGMESVPADSLYAVSRTAGKLCAQEMKSVKMFVSWTPQNEAAFRTSLLSAMSTIEESRRNKLCDCFISELKLKDPKGFISPMPKALQDSIAAVCMKRVPAKKSN